MTIYFCIRRYQNCIHFKIRVPFQNIIAKIVDLFDATFFEADLVVPKLASAFLECIIDVEVLMWRML